LGFRPSVAACPRRTTFPRPSCPRVFFSPPTQKTQLALFFPFVFSVSPLPQDDHAACWFDLSQVTRLGLCVPFDRGLYWKARPSHLCHTFGLHSKLIICAPGPQFSPCAVASTAPDPLATPSQAGPVDPGLVAHFVTRSLGIFEDPQFFSYSVLIYIPFTSPVFFLLFPFFSPSQTAS